MIAARAMSEMTTMDFVLMGPSRVRKQNRIQMVATGKTRILHGECRRSLGDKEKELTL
jgi:hypothetical protein